MNSIDKYKILRSEWKSVRLSRLRLKEELLARGFSGRMIRRNREHKKLYKEQQSLGRRILHMERKLNRKRVRLYEKEKR